MQPTPTYASNVDRAPPPCYAAYTRPSQRPAHTRRCFRQDVVQPAQGAAALQHRAQCGEERAPATLFILHGDLIRRQQAGEDVKTAIENLLTQTGLTWAQVSYMGDDVPRRR